MNARMKEAALAPHGISLIDHAEIAAAIAEGDRSEEAVLEGRGLTSDQWLASTVHWSTRMAEDAQAKGADAVVAVVYSEAFARAQDALKPAPQMSPEAWAKLVVEIQIEADPAGPLAERRLSLADYMRTARAMARLLTQDPAASRAFAETYQALQPKG